MSLFNINYLLFQFTEKLKSKQGLIFVLLSISFYTAFVLENIYLLNYTRLGILLTFSSLLAAIVIFGKSGITKPYRLYLILLVIAIIIGWNTRFPVILLLLPSLLAFIVLYFKPKRGVFYATITIFFTLIYIGLSFVILTNTQEQEFKALNKSEKYLNNILNGFNGKLPKEFSNERDSIKAIAFYRWYFADKDTLLNESFLEDLGGANPFQGRYLRNAVQNVKDEVLKSRFYYSHGYLEHFNWFRKSILFVFLVLLLPFLLFYFNFINGKDLKLNFLFVVISILMILGITAVFKMEDRVLTPFLIFVFLGTLLFSIRQEQKTSSSLLFYLLILFFGIVGISRLNGYHEVSKERKNGLQKKKLIIEELKTLYPDKYLFFDIYAYTLLETSPLVDKDYPKEWLSGPEMFNIHSIAHQQKIIDVVGCIDWPCFFEKISERKEEFVFVNRAERIQITEEYNAIIYDFPIKFKDISRDKQIKNLQYSFLWFPMDFGYYTIETHSSESMINQESTKSDGE